MHAQLELVSRPFVQAHLDTKGNKDRPQSATHALNTCTYALSRVRLLLLTSALTGSQKSTVDLLIVPLHRAGGQSDPRTRRRSMTLARMFVAYRSFLLPPVEALCDSYPSGVTLTAAMRRG